MVAICLLRKVNRSEWGGKCLWCIQWGNWTLKEYRKKYQGQNCADNCNFCQCFAKIEKKHDYNYTSECEAVCAVRIVPHLESDEIDFNANPCTKDNDKEKVFLIKADTFQWNLRAYPDTLIYPVSLFIDNIQKTPPIINGAFCMLLIVSSLKALMLVCLFWQDILLLT